MDSVMRPNITASDYGHFHLVERPGSRGGLLDTISNHLFYA